MLLIKWNDIFYLLQSGMFSSGLDFDDRILIDKIRIFLLITQSLKTKNQ